MNIISPKIPQHIHFVGIAGSGVSAAASIALDLGKTVSGSDRSDYPFLETLRRRGARISIGEHSATNVPLSTELLVASNAIFDLNPHNPELTVASGRGIPVLHYPEFVKLLLQGRKTIAIAGTHGKTTTTSMAVIGLHHSGKDPGYIIGGESRDLGGNASRGRDDLFVIEACEYQGSFLHYDPDYVILTNIDHDHVDCYPTLDSVVDVFENFVSKQSVHTLVLCGDDYGNQLLLQRLVGRGKNIFCYTYGFDKKNNVYAYNVHYDGAGNPSFDLVIDNEKRARLTLSVAGRHNILNALAVCGLVARLKNDGICSEVDYGDMLKNFHGTKRRLDLIGIRKGVKIYDDYAHHPTALRCTLEALRKKEGAYLIHHGGRLICVYQPHTYSRTQILLNEFAKSFDDADVVLVPTIMGAREQDPGTITSDKVVATINKQYGYEKAFLTPSFEDVVSWLVKETHKGDVVVTTSCGDVWKVAKMFKDTPHTSIV